MNRLLRISTVIAALALLGTSTGCGTSILTSYAVDEPFLRGGNDISFTQPIEPVQSSTRVYVDTSPLRVVCDTESIAPHVRVTRETDFSAVGRVWCGFMTLSEAALATGLFVNAKGASRAGSLVAGSILTADALGALAYAIFAPDQSRRETYFAPGRPQHDATCPSGLVLSSGAFTYAVGADGRVTGDARPFAEALLRSGAGATLTWGGRAATWFPDGQDRCALAVEYSDPNAAFFCGYSPVAPAPGTRALPPPPPPRAWWPGRATIDVRGGVRLP